MDLGCRQTPDWRDLRSCLPLEDYSSCPLHLDSPKPVLCVRSNEPLSANHLNIWPRRQMYDLTPDAVVILLPRAAVASSWSWRFNRDIEPD
jgi:hypothetical protein